MKQPRPVVLAGILLLCAGFKLVPYVLNQFGMPIDPETTYYPWNFSPILPLCLFAATYFGERRWSYLIPLGAWLVGDVGIWALTGRRDFAFYGGGQLFVYLSFVVVISLGFLLRRRHRSVARMAGAGFAGATLYFLLTNFGVWVFSSTYAATMDGLLLCYVRAVPFYRNSLISMAVFLPLLFSPVALRRIVPASSSVELPAATTA